MPTQHFPDELGPLIKEYRLSRIVPIILLSVATGFGLLSFAIPDNGFGYLALILAFVGFVVLSFGYFSPQRLWLHTNGFRLRGFTKQEDVLWQEVASVSVVYSVRIKPKSLLEMTYVLQSGERVKLHMGWSHRRKLAEHLHAILPTLPQVTNHVKSAIV